jgi:hypothetical protein
MRTLTALLFLVLSAPVLEAQWQVIEPGGQTICADGSAY